MLKTRFDTKSFTNIDDEDYIGRYDGEDYLIKAGETQIFPEFLVEHFAKHLIDKILFKKYGTTKDFAYTSPDLRQPLEEKIKGVIVAKAEQESPKTSGQALKQEVEEKQKEFEELAELKRKEDIREKRLKILESARKIRAEKNNK